MHINTSHIAQMTLVRKKFGLQHLITLPYVTFWAESIGGISVDWIRRDFEKNIFSLFM